jgi:phosphoribosylformylglycinamidine synthase
MERRRVLFVSAAAAAAAVLLGVLLVPSDEDKIKGQLSRLAKAVSLAEDDTNPLTRGLRVRKELEKTLDPSVHVSIPEVPGVKSGRDDLAQAAAGASLYVRALSVDLEDIEVKLDPARVFAKVGATAVVTATERDGSRRRDKRAVDFLFGKSDGLWRATSITVWPKSEASAP